MKHLLRQFACGELRRPDGARTALALRGRWGVGKTYQWRQVVNEVAADGRLGRGQYAYVSLFGLSSPDDVKAELVARRRTADDLDPYEHDLPERKLARRAKGLFGPYARLLKNHPGLRGVLGPGVAEAVAFDLFGRDLLVCFDDLERSDLTLKEVFGLVTHLRDERNCDVIVIVHDERLEGSEAAEFAAHGEKALDLQVTLEPTPGEAFEIAFKGWSEHRDLIRECCLRLAVSNVRLLYRIRSTLDTLLPRVHHLRDATVEGVVRGAVLLTWARHDSEGDAPSFDLVRKPHSHIFLGLKKDRSPDEQALLDLSARYGSGVDDGLDQHTAHYVDKGWFDEGALRAAVAVAETDDAAANARQRTGEAWALYGDSFEDNEAELVETLRTVYVAEATHIEPWNMDAAVRLLRELDREDLADELIDAFVRTHEGDPVVLRWRNHTASQSIKDPAFIACLDKLALQLPEARTLPEVLGSLALRDGWSSGETEFLASRPVDEYETYFRELRDPGLLRLAVRTCLLFGRATSGNAELTAIGQKATEALQRIGQSTRLNRMRVERKFEIKVGDPSDEEVADG